MKLLIQFRRKSDKLILGAILVGTGLWVSDEISLQDILSFLSNL